MKNKLIKLSAIILALVGLLGISAPAFAEKCTNICECDTVTDEIKASSGCEGYKVTDVRDSIMNIVNGVLGILGVVAVVVIVIGGVQYMISSGDPGKTKKAKDTILYAAIGLIIVALAAVIVNFVIANIPAQ